MYHVYGTETLIGDKIDRVTLHTWFVMYVIVIGYIIVNVYRKCSCIGEMTKI